MSGVGQGAGSTVEGVGKTAGGYLPGRLGGTVEGATKGLGDTVTGVTGGVGEGVGKIGKGDIIGGMFTLLTICPRRTC